MSPLFLAALLLGACNFLKPSETPSAPAQGPAVVPTAQPTSEPTADVVHSAPVATPLPSGSVSYETPIPTVVPLEDATLLLARAEAWAVDETPREMAREVMGGQASSGRGTCLMLLDAPEAVRFEELFSDAEYWGGAQKKAALTRRSNMSYAECSCAAKAVEVRSVNLSLGRSVRFAWLAR